MCYANEGDSQKKRENMAATSASRLTALTLQQSTFSCTRSSEERAGGREGKEKRCLAFLKLCYTGLGFGLLLKFSQKKVWLEECTSFKGMHPRTSRNSLNSFQPSKDKQNLNYKKTEANILHEIKSSLNRKHLTNASPSSCDTKAKYCRRQSISLKNIKDSPQK